VQGLSKGCLGCRDRLPAVSFFSPGRPRHGHCFLINPSLSLSLSLSSSSSRRTAPGERQRKMPEDKHSPYVSLCLTQRCFVSYKGTKEDSTWCAFISLDIPTKKPSARVILVIFSNCNPRTKAAQSQTKPSTTRNLLEGRHFYSKRTHSVVREHVLQ